MPILLARVDDRLIHGQVVHGWGRPLEITLFAIVSDELRQDAERAELYLLAVPEGARGLVVSEEEAFAPSFRGDAEAGRTMLLFADLGTPLRLVEKGFALGNLNVGGLHHAPGKRQVLPFVFLDGADLDRLRALAARGVRVSARDLPANAEHPLETLVAAP